MWLILFPFAHHSFGSQDIAVLHTNHDTVQVLSGFLYGIQISGLGLVQPRVAAAGQALGHAWLMEIQLYAFVFNGYSDAGLVSWSVTPLAVQRHVLISDVEDGFISSLSSAGSGLRKVALARLQLLNALMKLASLFFGGSFGAVVPESINH